MTGEFSYTDSDIQDVSDVQKLNVYKFDEATQHWVYCPSKVDSQTKTITFATHTFSNYTIMEHAISFNDIKKHWAQDAIELMASKYVANGMPSGKFIPEGNITRAEFAAMLVRGQC